MRATLPAEQQGESGDGRRRTSTISASGSGGRAARAPAHQVWFWRALQSQALQVGGELARPRLLLVAQQESGAIPMPFLVILAFWLIVLFASFGLFAPPNATAAVALLLSTLSVSGAILLILELAQPFAGLLQISSAPLRNAFAHLGQ